MYRYEITHQGARAGDTNCAVLTWQTNDLIEDLRMMGESEQRAADRVLRCPNDPRTLVYIWADAAHEYVVAATKLD